MENWWRRIHIAKDNSVRNTTRTSRRRRRRRTLILGRYQRRLLIVVDKMTVTSDKITTRADNLKLHIREEDDQSVHDKDSSAFGRPQMMYSMCVSLMKILHHRRTIFRMDSPLCISKISHLNFIQWQTDKERRKEKKRASMVHCTLGSGKGGRRSPKIDSQHQSQGQRGNTIVNKSKGDLPWRMRLQSLHWP
ncbi:hypothetical protein Mapa_014534 [Marchantia paleacea]|nr:hypothetical protein Mapa_014534 [Marchantia paleacea]